MNAVSFLTGLTPLQERLIDTCRAMAENDRVFIEAREILKVVALQDLQMDAPTFEYECEQLSSHLEPIESYSPLAVGYAYRLLLQMGAPWQCRYPFFELRGMTGDLHDDSPHGPEYVQVRLSSFCHTVMPVLGPPLLPIALLNGVRHTEGPAIPAHNLEELWMAFEQVRQDPDISLDQLMAFIPGPDFASGGVVESPASIRALYAEGKGALRLCGQIETEIEGALTRLAITSLPPGISVQRVMEKIRSLAQRGTVQFYNIQDQSQRDRIRIVVETPKTCPAAGLKEILFRDAGLSVEVDFQCSVTDTTGWCGGVSLIDTLKQAVKRCTLSWGRKDGEPIDYVPLLKEIQEYGGYKSPLSDFKDQRRSRLLECV